MCLLSIPEMEQFPVSNLSSIFRKKLGLTPINSDPEVKISASRCLFGCPEPKQALKQALNIEREAQKTFCRKWNFDIFKDKPIKGKLQWRKVEEEVQVSAHNEQSLVVIAVDKEQKAESTSGKEIKIASNQNQSQPKLTHRRFKIGSKQRFAKRSKSQLQFARRMKQRLITDYMEQKKKKQVHKL